MQTFLPYPDYHMSALCIDPDRAGNQLYNEGIRIFCGGSTNAWKDHPADLMWMPYKYQLCEYLLAFYEVLKSRDLDYERWANWINNWKSQLKPTGPPHWLGDERIHSSHRANLLRKNPEWYGQFGWKEEPAEGYWWPT